MDPETVAALRALVDQHRLRIVARVAAAILALGACVPVASAQTTYMWTPVGAGTYGWEAAGNWTGGDPNFADPNWVAAGAVFNTAAIACG